MNSVEALDALYGLVQTAWNAASTGPIKWPNSSGSLPTSGEWCRVAVQHVDGQQSSLADDTSKKKFTAYGVLYVQIFTPAADANLRGNVLADAIILAFRTAKISGMVFRRSRIREVGPDGAFDHIQALTGFEYETHA